jgi:hypothetical protein
LIQSPSLPPRWLPGILPGAAQPAWRDRNGSIVITNNVH